ncbi:hypothetical protein [Clostridium ihumii]|uniref:hypothetical protein n=1 Tax=Clostridium ihumii TaxID=1470356 RepID=UPI003D34A0A4
MSFRREVKMIIMLFISLYISKGFYDNFRIFAFFIPVYIWFLYGDLLEYYNSYVVSRLTKAHLWEKKVTMVIFEYSAIGALVLSLDNLFMSLNPVEKFLIGVVYLQYFLFLFLVGEILILYKLSYKRGMIITVVMGLCSMTELKITRFLLTLYDLRGTGGTNIFKSIIYLLLIDFIMYFAYFITNKLRGCNYETS